MGLKSTIQQAVFRGLKALDDLQESLTYQVAGTPTYNATTGSPAVSTTTYMITGTFVRYRREEIDGDVIRPEDQKCLIGSTILAPAIPTLNDTILRGSETWRVQGIRLDPAGALWVLQVRRP